MQLRALVRRDRRRLVQSEPAVVSDAERTLLGGEERPRGVIQWAAEPFGEGGELGDIIRRGAAHAGDRRDHAAGHSAP